MIRTVITDIRDETAALLEDGSQIVTTRPWPPLEDQKTQGFNRPMTDDGLITGSEDMQVVGTLAAPIEFWIPASVDNDRYITTLFFTIADAAATLSQFGAVTALTNGCRIFYERKSGEIDLHTTLKSNFDFVQFCEGQPAFGTGNDAFRGKNVSGNSEAYIPVKDLTKMSPPYGIRLARGTQQRFVLQVRDTTTGVDRFDVRVEGFDRIP